MSRATAVGATNPRRERKTSRSKPVEYWSTPPCHRCGYPLIKEDRRRCPRCRANGSWRVL